MRITPCRRGKCFCDGRPCATISVTKYEKDGKAYAERVHGVTGSGRGFKHLTECKDMVVSGDGHSLAAALLYSSISPRTSHVSDYLLSLCLCFHFCISLLALPCSRHSFGHLDIVTMRPLAPPQSGNEAIGTGLIPTRLHVITYTV